MQDAKDKGYISYVFNHTFIFNGGYSGNLETPAMTKSQTSYKNTINSKSKFRQVERKIDKINGIIEDIIEEQTETSNKLTQHEQTIDSISDRIESIQDVTQTVEGTKTLILANCVEGGLLELHIYGNNTVFKYLFPSDDLYPSDTLYPYGDSRIVVTDEDNNSLIYELGITDVLRQNGDVCDEYILQTGQAKVIRRINKDGTVKTQESIEELGEYAIRLKNGTNTIAIKNYTASLNAKYAIQNDYTDIFATKVEMNSSISQTAEEINIEVSKKVDANKVVSTINQSAEQITLKSNRLVVESNNFQLSETGNMTCNDATINGALISNGQKFQVDEEGNMLCNNATMNNAKCNNIEITNGKINMVLDDTTADVQSFTLYDNHNNIYLEFSGHGFDINGNINGIWTRGAVSVGLSANGAGGYIDCAGDITCNTLIQASKNEKKKYVKRINKKAVDLINNSDICQYQLKGEKETGHRHYGLVIGENYNCPDEVVSENGKGVEIYSMVALAWKAIQEQQEMIENLEKRIKELEGQNGKN